MSTSHLLGDTRTGALGTVVILTPDQHVGCGKARHPSKQRGRPSVTPRRRALLWRRRCPSCCTWTGAGLRGLVVSTRGAGPPPDAPITPGTDRRPLVPAAPYDDLPFLQPHFVMKGLLTFQTGLSYGHFPGKYAFAFPFPILLIFERTLLVKKAIRTES